ncbi:MAG: DUF1428 domain-containing protein [Halobacteriovoraceae bacterium]|nr:DUF1428 domain-containing protein [Halobacteriovoraceae bacterium]MCB9095345.1 DUF1428 domain-containing protein [Halobacteriovoraceae bacterium]
MKYVDGFVIPVPKERLGEYKKLAELTCKVWMDHGALSYNECVADDVKIGKWTSFPQSVDLKEDEIVVFAWITYESKEMRDKVNKLAISDPRFEGMDPKNLPFDGKRMIWGGFQKFLEA